MRRECVSCAGAQGENHARAGMKLHSVTKSGCRVGVTGDTSMNKYARVRSLQEPRAGARPFGAAATIKTDCVVRNVSLSGVHLEACSNVAPTHKPY